MTHSSSAAVKVARHVPLPVIDEAILHRTQGSGAVWGDSRRYPRFAATAEGLLTSEGTFAPAGPAPFSQTILLRDLSRGGLRFLHGAQLFPGDCCEIVLPNGAKKRLEIVWCRRVAAGVYMSGSHFLTIDAPSTDEDEDKDEDEDGGADE